jgi:two-component system response regulator YesN
MRIIIAEDEQRARRGLKNLIQMVSEECEVVADAPDGKKALELIKACKPEVVFTDIKMPYMDGIELIKEAKKNNDNIKFVIVSAYEEFQLAKQAISLGVTDYLVKPLIMEDVENVINKINNEIYDKKSEKDDKLNVHPIILKSLKIIEREYASPLSQKEIALRLGITAEYFCSLFAKEMNESFVKYMKRYRVEVAKALLKNGLENKDDVAAKVGYSDTKYFSKIFHEITGETVTEYMRNQI